MKNALQKQKLPTLVLATGNLAKVEEIKRLLRDVCLTPVTATDLGLSLPADEPYATFLENARHKALHVAAQTSLLVLGEDSGLEVDALGGRPGVLSKRYSGPHGDAGANNAKLLQELKDVPHPQRKARFRCVAVLAIADSVLISASGVCEGIIAQAPEAPGALATTRFSICLTRIEPWPNSHPVKRTASATAPAPLRKPWLSYDNMHQTPRRPLRLSRV